MNHWLVKLSKKNTAEDFKNGALGRNTIQSVIVLCERKNVRKSIKGFDGWKIESVRNWDVLQERSILESMKYILTSETI